MEWKRDYGKDDDDGDMDLSRLENFKQHYLRLQATNAAELQEARAKGEADPIPLTLNEYADLSIEEFQSLQTTMVPEPTTTTILTARYDENDDVVDEDDDEQQRIRSIYQEWCRVNDKNYEESRLEIFAKNLLAVESFRQETGKNAALNKYADLTPDEYRRAVEEDGKSFRGSSYLEKLSSVSTPLSPVSSPSSYLDNLSSLDNLSRVSYLDNLSSSSSPLPSSFSSSTPITSSTAEDRIRQIYLDWCNYYDKPPSESRLQTFAGNLVILEKHHRETGERLTLNEIADQMGFEQRIVEEARRTNAEAAQRRQREQEEEEEKQRQQAEQARLEGEQRLAEQARLEEERRADEARREERRLAEEARLEEERKREEEAQLQEEQRKAEGLRFGEQQKREVEAQLQEEQRKAEELRLEEERRREVENQLQKEQRKADELRLDDERNCEEEGVRLRLGQTKSEEARLYEERRRVEAASLEAELRDEMQQQTEEGVQIDDRVPGEQTQFQMGDAAVESDEDTEESEPQPLIVPRSSYMEAVAKTWVDRSSYLESLQQGRSTILPDNPVAEPEPVQNTKGLEENRSQSLIDSIWNFMNTPQETTRQRKGYSATGQYASKLIREADETIADAIQSSAVDADELRYLKEAVDALRRRNNDDRAAKVARMKTEEWREIQIGLEKEAQRAKERRLYEERIAEEARQKARSVESVVIDERPITPQSKLFSQFFGGNEQENDQVQTESNRPFSFLPGGAGNLAAENPPIKSFTKAIMPRKKESWLDRLFDFRFFDAEQQQEVGRGTITLEPAKRTSVFDFFVSPDLLRAQQPGRGSITIERSLEPSFLSFFANVGNIKPRDLRGDDQSSSSGPPTDNPFASFFGDSKAIAAEVDPERMRKVQNYESRRRSRQEKTAWLEAGRSRILEQSDRKLSRKEARRLQRELDDLAVGSFSASSGADVDIPQLAKWQKTPDGRITGYVSQSTAKFRRGTKITTSRIKGQTIRAGVIITTLSGSQYRLLMPFSNQPMDSLGQSAAEQPPKQPAPSFQPLVSLFGGMFAEGDIPTLVEWRQNEDGTLTGFVNNKQGFDDGTVITTSPVDQVAKPGMVVQTIGGSKYKLSKNPRERVGDK